MNRILTIITLLVLSLSATAARYAVRDIPNVQLADSTQLLSDPDGIVGDSASREIDSLLLDIRRRTSAEVAVVVVSDFDGEDSDEFATALFKSWGIGRRGSDNGVLLFVAKERRCLTIRTGYGVEGLLPDIVCGHIIRHLITPHFREDRYGDGVLAGVGELHRLLTDPEAAEELQARLKGNADGGDVLLCFLSFFSLFALLAWLLMKHGGGGGRGGSDSGTSGTDSATTPRPRRTVRSVRSSVGALGGLRGGSFGGGSTGGGGASGRW